MAETTQYKFDLLEVGALLIEKQQITSGKWQIGVGFDVAAVEAGPSPDKVRPSMVLSVAHLVLTAASQDGPMVIDAANLKKKRAVL